MCGMTTMSARPAKSWPPCASCSWSPRSGAWSAIWKAPSTSPRARTISWCLPGTAPSTPPATTATASWARTICRFTPTPIR